MVEELQEIVDAAVRQAYEIGINDGKRMASAEATEQKLVKNVSDQHADEIEAAKRDAVLYGSGAVRVYLNKDKQVKIERVDPDMFEIKREVLDELPPPPVGDRLKSGRAIVEASGLKEMDRYEDMVQRNTLLEADLVAARDLLIEKDSEIAKLNRQLSPQPTLGKMCPDCGMSVALDGTCGCDPEGES